MPPLDAVRVRGFHPRVLDDPNRLNGVPLTYALGDGRYLKIGRSGRHPVERARDLQTGNAGVLVVLAWTTTVTEAQVHRRLSRYRLRGEWFRPAPAVLEELLAWDFLDLAALDALRRGSMEGGR
jgi:hypothetical protein